VRLKTGRGEVHLVAHIDTAVLSTTCLQFKPLGPPFPVKASKRFGNGGLAAPANDAAALARRVGRYRLRAVTER
jgi:hypothetical protein